MYDFNKCFKKQITNWEKHTEGIILHKEGLMQIDNYSNQPKLAQVMALINPSALSINTTTYTPSMLIDPMFIALKAC